jgi:hypothetical protein
VVLSLEGDFAPHLVETLMSFEFVEAPAAEPLGVSA